MGEFLAFDMTRSGGPRRSAGAEIALDRGPPMSAPTPLVIPTGLADAVDWARVDAALEQQGNAVIPGLLPAATCATLASGFDAGVGEGERFRSHVVMARHGYGRGEYKYYGYPLPPLLSELRTAIYPRLVPVANRWNEALRREHRFPASHAEFLQRCHAAGQTRPTPLLLRYGPGDYNCLHQDLYGEHVFPLQVAVLLSRPGTDFTGGEFVLTEQRPRMQSRVEVVPLQQGDAVVFAVHERPVASTRKAGNHYRVKLRHGVSQLRSGQRHTLGIIFHDAA
jgi:hypothetical protein